MSFSIENSLFICLGITFIILGFLGVYMYQKMNEQNHKITSMLELVSTMANEMNFIKSRMRPVETINRQQGEGEGDEGRREGDEELIHVSDEDEDEEDEESDDDESDDEESADDEEEDSDSEDEDETKIKSIHIGGSNFPLVEERQRREEEEEDEEEEQGDTEIIDDIDFDELEEGELEEGEGEEGEGEGDREAEIVNNFTFESIMMIDAKDPEELVGDFNLEEMKSNYKNLTLDKLKSLVVEKGLSNVAVASKLKKNKLLKMLGVE